MTPAECTELGRRVGRRVCPFGLWAEDVAAAATLGAWLSPGHESTGAWFAAVDELRRLTGHDRHGRGIGQTVPLVVDPPVEDCYELDDVLAPLDARGRWVVEMIARGWQRREVALALGVTPSMVSQILARVRRIVASSLGEV